MKCKYCNQKVIYDLEGNIIHIYLDNKGVDDRLCYPTNPDSKIAEYHQDIEK